MKNATTKKFKQKWGDPHPKKQLCEGAETEQSACAMGKRGPLWCKRY